MIYGNPSFESIELIANSNLLREWDVLGRFDPLYIMQPPCEITTQKELWYLVELAETISPSRMIEIELLEADMFSCWSKYLASLGVTATPSEVKQCTVLYDPICDYLKVAYNRPRPFQAAAHYGIPLFPRLKTDASTAAYPSGHTFLSLLIYDHFARSRPDLEIPLMKYVLDVKLSREQGGVHYPSDGLFSFQIYRHIRQYIHPIKTFTV